MANQMGQTNQSLITGRIAYTWNGTEAKPLLGDSAGRIYSHIQGEKTIGTELLPITAVAASSIVASSVLSSTTAKKATLFIDHGRTVVTAFGTNGTQYIVQTSEKANGNDTWVDLTSFTCVPTVSVAVVADGDAAAGASTILCGTAVAVMGDNVFWANSTAITQGEWGKVAAVSGTVSFTLLDPLTNAQDSDTNIFTQAEHFALVVDMESLLRLRVVVNNNASGTTYAIQSRVAVITET
jgi:hypothetical protein